MPSGHSRQTSIHCLGGVPFSNAIVRHWWIRLVTLRHLQVMCLNNANTEVSVSSLCLLWTGGAV